MKDIELWSKAQDGYKQINPNYFSVDLNKSYIFGFSGNGNFKKETTTGLIGFIGRAVGMKNDDLTGSQKDFEVLAVKYDKDEDGVGKLSPRQHRQFANNILTPFFVDESFRRYELEQAIENANKITFFSYCSGAVEIGKIVNELKNNLIIAGYESDEVSKIFNNIWHVSYAPQILNCNKAVEAINYGLRTFRFMGLSDKLFADSYKNMLGKDLDGVEARKATLFNGVEVFFSKLLNTASKINPNVDDHKLSTLMKGFNWDNPDYKDVEDGCGVIKTAPVRNVVSDMLGYVTAVGMTRSITGREYSNSEIVGKFNAIKSDYNDEDLKVR